jgi:hypothetical protein
VHHGYTEKLIKMPSRKRKFCFALIRLIEDRNELQTKINVDTPDEDYHCSLLTEIDDWQRTTIKKVTKTAEQIRQQVIQCLKLKKLKTKSHFEKFSQDLNQLKETGDFVESDLKQLEQIFDQLKHNLKQLHKSPELELCTKRSQQIE